MIGFFFAKIFSQLRDGSTHQQDVRVTDEGVTADATGSSMGTLGRNLSNSGSK